MSWEPFEGKHFIISSGFGVLSVPYTEVGQALLWHHAFTDQKFTSVNLYSRKILIEILSVKGLVGKKTRNSSRIAKTCLHI